MINPTTLDRVARALRLIIEAEFPGFAFGGLYEYSVVSAANGTIDGRPTDTTLGLPDLVGIPLGPTLHGGTVKAAAGNLALIEFVDGDPSQPECVGLLGVPEESTIDAKADLEIGPHASKVELGLAEQAVARINDAVAVYLDPAVPLVLTGTLAGAPFTGTLTPVVGGVPTPAVGLITGGSSKVVA